MEGRETKRGLGVVRSRNLLPLVFMSFFIDSPSIQLRLISGSRYSSAGLKNTFLWHYHEEEPPAGTFRGIILDLHI